MSVILHSVISTAEEITRFLDQVKSRLISQLINGISRVLQELLKYSNGTAILTFFILLEAGVFPVILDLYLNDSDCYIFIWIISVILPQTSWCFE